MWCVEFQGFLQGTVRREFETEERARQWAAQCGKTPEAKIFEKPTLGENITVNGNKLLAFVGTDQPREILEIMEIDLRDVRETLCDACEWYCGIEDKWWPITAKFLTLTDEYAVRWTDTDEAGINDVQIVKRVDDEEDAESLAEYVREIAAELGTVRD